MHEDSRVRGKVYVLFGIQEVETYGRIDNCAIIRGSPISKQGVQFP